MKQANQYHVKVKDGDTEENVFIEANDMKSANEAFQVWLVEQWSNRPHLYRTSKLRRAYKSSNSGAYTPYKHDATTIGK